MKKYYKKRIVMKFFIALFYLNISYARNPINSGKEEELRAYLKAIDEFQEENEDKNVFQQIWSNGWHLFPKILDLEGEFVNMRSAGKKNVVDNLFPYCAELGIDYVLGGINLTTPYWHDFWTTTKLEIAVKYIGRTSDFLMKKIENTIHHGDIYRKIDRKNYFFKSMVISKKNREIFTKIFYVLNLSLRQKLIYIVGAPGTGKTTMVIDQLLRRGYTVYYLNGNNILLSDKDVGNIMYILEQLSYAIRRDSAKKKLVIVLDECEVAFRDVKKLKKILKDMQGNKDNTLNRINENMILKEIAFTSFMLYLLSLSNVQVICVANSTEISRYMIRRITYFVHIVVDFDEYLDMWNIFLKHYNISFNEGNRSDLIYEICIFSVKHKISVRTIKQFVLLFEGQTISINDLFTYCNRIEE